MVADKEIQVWQDGDIKHGCMLKIQPRYIDDPWFTPEQEKAIYEIARSFLIDNRQRERRKRYAESRKKKQEGK